ncbi:Ovate protein family, C-terminal [Sesbania bispinosa]|nr:Ovate protein family, C-terminal [Sesbania bispinosa]
MGKKTLKLPSLFKTKESPPPLLRKHPWQLFPSFSQRRNLKSTLSSDDLVFPDPTDDDDENYRYGESLEMFVSRGVRSERLFFEPGGNTTSSILEKAKADHNGNGGFPLEENGVVLLAMESEDPCGDFRRSMEEMVESHGVKGWKGLEELLSWYLMIY